MPKPKRGTALFDLLAEEPVEGSDKLKVPPWWGRKPARSDTATDGAELAPAPPDAARRPVELGDTTAEPGSAPARFFELDGACIRVSLTTKSASIAVFAALVVILGTFGVGRWIGEKSGFKSGYATGRESYAAGAASDIELARNQPPATHLVEGLLEERREPVGGPESASGRGGAADQTRWVKGNDYIVAQEFLADRRDDALRAQEFLGRRGVPTELIRLPNKRLQLMTTQGYNRKDAVQRRLGDDLLAKVHAAGEKYFSAGGGYRLKGYFKTRKGDTW